MFDVILFGNLILVTNVIGAVLVAASSVLIIVSKELKTQEEVQTVKEPLEADQYKKIELHQTPDS